jgi:uncharacterized protein
MLDVIIHKAHAISAICRRFDVRLLEVFGSAARESGDAAVGDIDFAVSFNQIDRRDAFGQFFDLKKELSSLLGKPVDLVEISAVRNPYVRKTIEEDKKLVFAA